MLMLVLTLALMLARSCFKLELVFEAPHARTVYSYFCPSTSLFRFCLHNLAVPSECLFLSCFHKAHGAAGLPSADRSMHYDISGV